MCILAEITLITLVAGARAKPVAANHSDSSALDVADQLADQLVDNLVDRRLTASPLHYRSLEQTTRGKSGLLDPASRLGLRPLPPPRAHRHFNPGGRIWPEASYRRQAPWQMTLGRHRQDRARDGASFTVRVGRSPWEQFGEKVFGPSFGDDDSEEATLLRAATRPGSPNSTEEILSLMGSYVQKRVLESTDSILANNSEAIVQVVNSAIVLVFLRTLVPRIIAAESTGDLSELAQAVGLPSKEELAGYLSQMQETPLPVKLVVFFGIFLVEKVFVLSTVPFLPLTVILPAIAPAVFGNFLAGVLVSLGASTTGAVANFYLGAEIVSKKVEDFKVGKNPPIKDSDWYKAIQKATQKEPFKTTLLLRLAPILPIPLDAHWYVCGVMKMDPLRFISAYALGSLKPIFIDAYFGSLLTNPLLDDSVKQQSTIVVCLEVAFIVTASIVATSLATSSLSAVLQESNVTLPTAGE